MGALAGIKVLDLSRVLAGPYCSQTLADLGAEVWKIEPLWGDETRQWGPPFVAPAKPGFKLSPQGESAYFLSVNRGKKSLALNLKHPQGPPLVKALAQKADVMLENYKVGDLARYGLDYPSLSKLNPGLVYLSLTGFGQTGPRATEAGYDAALQGYTGIMSVTGEPSGPPMKVGVAWIDLLTGQSATIAVLAALLERSRSGLGQHLDIALFDVGLAALVNLGQSHLLSGQNPTRHGNAHAQIVPYGSFAAADGWLVLAVGNDAQFQKLCQTIGRLDLAQDPRFEQNPGRVMHRQALVQQIEHTLQQQPKAHWLGLLTSAGVPCAPVNTLSEAFADPQAQARGLRQTLPHPTLGSLPVMGSPLAHFSRTPAQLTAPPPLLGQHSQQILQEVLGLSPAQIQEFRRNGVVG